MISFIIYNYYWLFPCAGLLYTKHTIGADFSFFSSYGKGVTPSPPLPSPPFPSPFFPRPSPLEIGPLNTARGLGERCKLPQWGLGRSPSRQTIWCMFEPKRAALVATFFVDFPTNKCNFLLKNKHDTRRKRGLITSIISRSSQ